MPWPEIDMFGLNVLSSVVSGIMVPVFAESVLVLSVTDANQRSLPCCYPEESSK